MKRRQKKIISISGRIYGIYYTLTRKEKRKMAIISLESLDNPNKVQKAVIMPSVFEKVSKWLKLDTCVQAEGAKDVSTRNQIIANDLVAIRQGGKDGVE